MKLIAMDLDGTLLREDKTVSEHTASVLNRCRAAGHSLAFVTARSEVASQRVSAIIRPEVIVSCGGARVRRFSSLKAFETNEGETIRAAPLERGTADAVISFCKNQPSVGRLLAELVCGTYYVSNEVDPAATGDYTHAVQFDFSSPLPCDAWKLVVQLSGEADRAKLRAAFPNITVHGYTKTNWCFISSPRATKWRGLAAAAAALGVRNGEIVAFGDDENDVEMLKNSGTGVAMGNAIPAAKAAADEVCGGNDEEGLANWLAARLL